tara:strand:- start:10404 stop:11033 length:630 start_codon:yes stop_codon:yes gene_type:complete
MKLVVGTESTWSLRVWICLQLANIKVTEEVIDLSSVDYKAKILAHSPTGLVPAFIDGNIEIYDSLAITEYINESSHGCLYPVNVKQRAIARSLCAEMHSGFMNLRQQFPFTLQGVTQNKQAQNPAAKNPLLNDDIKKELSRIEAIFESATLPFMFELAGAVDAFYAILAFRLKSYGIIFEGKAGEYQHSLLDWPLLNKAIAQAQRWENK